MADEKTLRYCLVQDDDCHWYIIPSNNREECAEHFRKVYKYWGGDSSEGLPNDPDWLRPVGGSPSLVTFTNPEIE